MTIPTTRAARPWQGEGHDAYVAAMTAAVNNPEGIRPDIARYLIDTCTECDEIGFHGDGEHVVIDSPAGNGRTFVIVGCEGYRFVDPNLVGISAPYWTDTNGNQPT